MKFITKKQQEEIDKMIIKKLRFVARATLQNFKPCKTCDKIDTYFPSNEILTEAMNCAEKVFYADSVI